MAKKRRKTVTSVVADIGTKNCIPPELLNKASRLKGQRWNVQPDGTRKEIGISTGTSKRRLSHPTSPLAMDADNSMAAATKPKSQRQRTKDLEMQKRSSPSRAVDAPTSHAAADASDDEGPLNWLPQPLSAKQKKRMKTSMSEAASSISLMEGVLAREKNQKPSLITPNLDNPDDDVPWDAPESSDESDMEKSSLKVFIGGIPWTLSEDQVKNDFAECGKLEEFIMPKGRGHNFNEDVRRHRGVAFLKYSTEEGVRNALKFDASEYWGHNLRVKLSNPPRKAASNDIKSGGKGKGKGKRKMVGKFKNRGSLGGDADI